MEGDLTGGNPNYLEFTQERLGYHIYMPYMRSGNIFSHLMLCDKLQQSITGDSGSHFGSGLLKKVITFVKDKLLLIILPSD